MFHPGERIMYGSTGVCTVKEVGQAKSAIADPNRLYYTLEPVFGTGVIFIPVDTKVFMRPLISREEAEQLVQQIPSIEEDVCHDRNITMLKGHYEASMQAHTCEQLVQVIKSVYTKNLDVIQKGRKLGQVDRQYQKRAQDMLYGELAVVLDVPRDQMEKYIENQIASMHTVAAAPAQE